MFQRYIFFLIVHDHALKTSIKTEKWQWKQYEDKLLKSIRKAVENFSKSAKHRKDSYLTSGWLFF